MFLCYVDESGDTGVPGQSRHFILTALVVHELRWLSTLDQLIEFRRHIRTRYGFKVREELHAQQLLFRPGDASRIPKSVRLHMLGDVLSFTGTMPDISIVNVVIDKSGKPPQYDVFANAWKALLQRLHMGVQMHTPNGYVKKKGARNWFLRTEPSLYKPATRANALGIVEL